MKLIGSAFCFLFLALVASVAAEGGKGYKAPKSPKPTKNIVMLAASTPQLSTLVTAVSAVTGLPAALESTGPFTVFAPNNAAFAKLPAGTIQTLLKNPNGKLASILKYHVVAGRITAQMLKTGEVTTLQGGKIKLKVNKNGSVVLNGNVNVIATNIFATNGVVHVIDGVLSPPM